MQPSTTAAARHPRTSADRSAGVARRAGLAGASGLAFLVLIAVQNLLKAALGPANVASAADLHELTHGHAWSVHLLVVTYALGFPALLLFATGLSRWCTEQEPRAGGWSGLGRASAVVIATLFGFVNILQATMVAARDQLDADPRLAQFVWTLHNAVFTINFIAVGAALLGLGRAATLAGLIPSWMGPTTAVGGGLLVAASLPAVAVIHGSPWMVVGLIGFLVWMLFLAMAGVALLYRSPVTGRPAAARTA